MKPYSCCVHIPFLHTISRFVHNQQKIRINCMDEKKKSKKRLWLKPESPVIAIREEANGIAAI